MVGAVVDIYGGGEGELPVSGGKAGIQQHGGGSVAEGVPDAFLHAVLELRMGRGEFPLDVVLCTNGGEGGAAKDTVVVEAEGLNATVVCGHGLQELEQRGRGIILVPQEIGPCCACAVVSEAEHVVAALPGGSGDGVDIDTDTFQGNTGHRVELSGSRRHRCLAHGACVTEVERV